MELLQGEHFPRNFMGSPTWKTPKSSNFCDFMEASSHKHNHSLTPFSTFLLSQENGSRAENSKLLINDLLLLVTSSHPGDVQKLTQSHLIKIKETPISQGNYKDFRSSVPGTRGRDQIHISSISQNDIE